MWFKKNLNLTVKEQQFEEVLVKILKQNTTKKKLKLTATEKICLVVNEEKSVKIKIDDVGIVIQNSVFKIMERLPEKVCVRFKKLVIDSMNKDTDEELNEMDEKDKNLIERINNSL